MSAYSVLPIPLTAGGQVVVKVAINSEFKFAVIADQD